MEEGMPRITKRDAPPSHFIFKIESFSKLLSSSLVRYESCVFDAGDYKWRLALYPNGNNDDDGKDHLSLYLVLDKSCSNIQKEILVKFSLFAFDHCQDKYLSVDNGLSRFHGMKTELGFDKFLSHKVLKDSSNGYLINDTCMFGAEVFVINSTMQGQCLSMVAKEPVPFKYTWRIENFSKLEDKPYHSDKFATGGHDWNIFLYPKGNGKAKGNCVSLFLGLADSKSLAEGSQVFLKFKLRVVNQLRTGKHNVGISARCFNASNQTWAHGWESFLNLSEMEESTGFLLKDTCIVEAEVSVIGSAKDWE